MSGLDVDAGTVRDVFVRHIPHGADPLHQPSHPADGRWQRGRLIEAWYVADEPGTAWAEWYRALAGTGVSPVHTLPRDLWRWRIDLDRVALLDSDERLARTGLAAPLPASAQWPAFQAVGEALHSEGFAALLVASAARPEHRNLVVFRPQRLVAGCTPQPPPMKIDVAPPVPRGLRT